MSISIKIPFEVPMVLATLGATLASPGTAQTFAVLHSFTRSGDSYAPYTNADGMSPEAGLVLRDNTLYGTTTLGGASSGGTVFAVSTDGSDFRALHSFSNEPLAGGHPRGLVLSGSTLYGAAEGNSGWYFAAPGGGMVYKVNTDGTGFQALHTFSVPEFQTNSGGEVWPINSDGANPNSAVILKDDTLYGTTAQGGSKGRGTLFAVKTDGTGFRILRNFGEFDSTARNCPLTVSGNTLFGECLDGDGTVFAVNLDGTGFTNLSDAVPSPAGGLLWSRNRLYGTCLSGGDDPNGSVFALNTDGTAFTNLHSFSPSDLILNTNSDGTYPESGLILVGDRLYGATVGGGRSGNGTVFALNIDGSGFTVLHHFAAGYPSSTAIYTNLEGASPNGLVLAGSTLFGTTRRGGPWGNGTLFSISLRPELAANRHAEKVVLTWTTNLGSYRLQSSTNLGPFAIWATHLPAPMVVNGQYTVTNPISGGQQFFRLSQ